MAKIDLENLRQALEENNEWLKQYVYDTITQFSPTMINAARILSHLSNTTIHITREDKELWNSTFDRAKEYMDETFKSMTSIDLRVVDELPTSNISESSIYLKKIQPSEDIVYQQYIYSNGKWVSLGKTSVDMSNYYTKDEINKLIKDIMSTAKHSHNNQDVLDLITAAYTLEEKQALQRLASVDMKPLADHISNDTIHLTEQEKLMLKDLTRLNVDAILNHLSNTTIHLNDVQISKINDMLTEAKRYTDEKIENLIIVSTVSALPEDPSNNTLYLVPNQTPSEYNTLDKYICVGGKMEKLNTGSKCECTEDEPPGSSGDTDDIDLSSYCTRIYMEHYVNERTHNHENKSTLDEVKTVFTSNMLEKLNDTANGLISHQGSNAIHLSSDQIALINKMNNLESTIDTRARNIVQSLVDPNFMAHISRASRVGALPDINDADDNTLYLVETHRYDFPSYLGTEYPNGMSCYDAYVVGTVKTSGGTIRCWSSISDDCVLTSSDISGIIAAANN